MGALNTLDTLGVLGVAVPLVVQVPLRHTVVWVLFCCAIDGLANPTESKTSDAIDKIEEIKVFMMRSFSNHFDCFFLADAKYINSSDMKMNQIKVQTFVQTKVQTFFNLFLTF